MEIDMSQYRVRLRVIAALGVMSFGLALSLCSSDARAQAPGSAASLLPPQYKSGISVVTSNGTSPPFSYHPDGDANSYRESTLTLPRAIGAKLGVPINFSSSDFAGIIPAVLAGRDDLAMFGITDTLARHQQVDMIDYLSAGTSIIVVKGNPLHIKSLADLCGKNVAVVSGSSQATIAQTQSAKCSTPINITQFPTKAETICQRCRPAGLMRPWTARQPRNISTRIRSRPARVSSR